MNDTQIDLGDGLWLQLSTPHETRVIREYLEDLWQWKVDCEEFRRDLLKSEARVKELEEALSEIATDEHPLGWIAIAALTKGDI
jgi:hypothetical protein